VRPIMIKKPWPRLLIPALISLIFYLLSWSGGPLAETPINPTATLSFHILLNQKNCQMAIWLTDENGNFVDTVYVTKKTAQKGMGNRGGGLDDRFGGSRLSTLPVWAHQRGVDYGGGNFYPTRDQPLPDAVSSATPRAGDFIWEWRPEKDLKPGKYYYYVEVNKSFDRNDSHDYSWYRGQPSVVWRGDLQVGERPFESRARIVGHGHVAGKDGSINPDLSTLTTALRLIEAVKVIYKPTGN
jgi:hypothetical protein